MDFERPVIKLKPTQTDVWLDGLALAGVIFLCIYILAKYARLPETVPTHYNFKGKVDGYGSKATILILPCLSIVLFIGLSLLNQYPHIFNYPVTITKENAQQHYTWGTRIIRYLKLIIVVTFIFISINTIDGSHNKKVNLGWWFGPLLIVLGCVPSAIYLYKTRKRRQ